MSKRAPMKVTEALPAGQVPQALARDFALIFGKEIGQHFHQAKETPCPAATPASSRSSTPNG